MSPNLPTCPKCQMPADDIMGDVCGHEIHEPYVLAERERLEALSKMGSRGIAGLNAERAPSRSQTYWHGFHDGRDHVIREVARVLLADPSGIDNERLAVLRELAGGQ